MTKYYCTDCGLIGGRDDRPTDEDGCPACAGEVLSRDELDHAVTGWVDTPTWASDKTVTLEPR